MQKSLTVIRSFVRREGRFTKGQQAAIKNFWPVYGIEVTERVLDFEALFGNKQPVILDIGFGNGEALALVADQQPRFNFLGVEVYRPGIGSLFKKITNLGLQNIRVANVDAVDLLKHNIATESLISVLIWFPDPWPKKKHHKRRLIQTKFVKLLENKLVYNGELNIATDWQPYAIHIQETLKQFDSFKAKKTSRVIKKRPKTKFERRGEKLGHSVFSQVYIKTN